jgi:hypothetical protein
LSADVDVSLSLSDIDVSLQENKGIAAITSAKAKVIIFFID